MDVGTPVGDACKKQKEAFRWGSGLLNGVEMSAPDVFHFHICFPHKARISESDAQRNSLLSSFG